MISFIVFQLKGLEGFQACFLNGIPNLKQGHTLEHNIGGDSSFFSLSNKSDQFSL
jgi:hypothetical protein